MPRILLITTTVLAALMMAFPAFAANDPSGDVPTAIDMTNYTTVRSGRGVAFTFAFAGSAPRASSSLTVCSVTDHGKFCLASTDRHIYFKGIKIQAKVNRSTHNIRIWVRAADLNLWPGQTLTSHGRTSLVNSGTCATTCVDATTPATVKYVQPYSCNARQGKWTNGNRTRKLIALTFDDGPHSATKLVLDNLRAAHVPATFYMIGNQVSGHPAFLRRMVKEGHELGNHSWRHESYPSTSSIQSTNRAIRSISGHKPCTFRPPYGAVNSALVSRAGSLGMATIIWDIDTRDWATHSTSQTIKVGSSGRNGSIVLMHDGGGGNWSTARAVPQIVKNYKARGYTFVTVDELLNFQPR